MIRSEHGETEISGTGKEILDDLRRIISTLYSEGIVDVESMAGITALATTIIDIKEELGIQLNKESEKISIDIEELKKQMEDKE